MDLATEVYRECIKAKSAVENLLEDFDRGRDRSVAVQQRLTMLQSEFSSCVDRLHEVANRDNPTWDKRVRMLGSDRQQIDKVLSAQLGFLHRQRKDEEKRHQLFGDEKRGEHNEMKAALNEQSGWARSHQMVDELREAGSSIVNGMRGNNSRLKSSQKKVLDVANLIGLSSGLVNVIQRRHATDRGLVYGCMLFTGFFFFMLYYYWKT